MLGDDVNVNRVDIVAIQIQIRQMFGEVVNFNLYRFNATADASQCPYGAIAQFSKQHIETFRL